MDFLQRSQNYPDLRVLTVEQMGGLSRETSPRLQLEHDKRARREIANSNERRRMESINTGFQRIRSLLPQCEEEKMSKSAILHQAVDYINRLKQEKQLISQQNKELMHMLQTFKTRTQSMPPTKRRKNDDDTLTSDLIVSSIDSMNNCSQNTTAILTELQNLVFSLKEQLNYERQRRVAVEKRVDGLKTCLKMERHVGTCNDRVDDEIAKVSVALPSGNLPHVLLAKHSTVALSGVDDCHDRSAVARRNLETIVKAIHHVEGGDLLTNTTEDSKTITQTSGNACAENLPQQCISASTFQSVLCTVSDSGNLGSVAYGCVAVSRPPGAEIFTSLKPVPVLFASPVSSNSVIAEPGFTQMPS